MLGASGFNTHAPLLPSTATNSASVLASRCASSLSSAVALDGSGRVSLDFRPTALDLQNIPCDLMQLVLDAPHRFRTFIVRAPPVGEHLANHPLQRLCQNLRDRERRNDYSNRLSVHAVTSTMMYRMPNRAENSSGVMLRNPMCIPPPSVSLDNSFYNQRRPPSRTLPK